MFSIWDYHCGTKLTYCASRGNKISRITALEFINSHDVALLMVGSDDGSVRIWKNYSSTLSRNPILLTAWQALADIQPATKTSSGVLEILDFILCSILQILNNNCFLCTFSDSRIGYKMGTKVINTSSNWRCTHCEIVGCRN